MDILDLFGLDTGTQLTQSQKKQKANERSNLLVISRIVLKGFLKASLKLRHRMLEGDIQQLCDLLVMLEKVLWHGFKSRYNILIRGIDTELWRCLTRISATSVEMNECVQCIINLENLVTPIARIRAFLRLAVMQKRLADYFQYISSSQILRDSFMKLVEENNDTINTLRKQLVDTKKVNENLYLEIRMAEEKCKLFENDLILTKERHVKDIEKCFKASEELKTKILEKDAEIKRNSSTMDMLKNEYINKTEEYMQTLNILSKKQEELNSANVALEKARKQNIQFAEKLKEIPILKHELAELNADLEQQSKKIADYENALEELGIHLSESGLRILELKEEFLPFSEAQWQDDSSVTDCKACGVTFSVSRRKHHCRCCGMIFCNTCSDGRIKLPSNPKPVRVCVSCYNLLRSRQNSSN
uniref:FYVE-type domain-containing protein n=1 Tax=Syphacia muris TaxID=451379 RepID=A0A158R5H4_9BILA